MPPMSDADVPAALRREVATFLTAARAWANTETVKPDEIQQLCRPYGQRIAEVGGGWGAMAYASWELQLIGIHAPEAHAGGIEKVLEAVRRGWTGIAGWGAG